MSAKTTQLRRMLDSGETEFILEAHNGLAARIVEEAGFKGIWGSGLAISAQHAVRDNNELSWTQVLQQLEFMSDATTIPILLDGDTGYGDFNNMRRLVRKLEQIDVAGVCIEDKLFPKTNSFIQGEAQPLEDIETFCGKIKAGKDSQSDDDFSIVARVEAFIAGWGLEEALKRAEAYRQAGADAILMHSKQRQPNEVLAFAKEWANRAPLVIVLVWPNEGYEFDIGRVDVRLARCVGDPVQAAGPGDQQFAIAPCHTVRVVIESQQHPGVRVRRRQPVDPAGFGTEQQVAVRQEGQGPGAFEAFGHRGRQAV